MITALRRATRHHGRDGIDAFVSRVVHYQVRSARPGVGWPAVFMFQGSFISAAYTFSASSAESTGSTTGRARQGPSRPRLCGPRARDARERGSYWQTNIGPTRRAGPDARTLS